MFLEVIELLYFFVYLLCKIKKLKFVFDDFYMIKLKSEISYFNRSYSESCDKKFCRY